MQEAKRRLEEQLAVQKQANAAFERRRLEARDVKGRRLGGGVKPVTLPDTPAETINTTDLDSRLQKTSLGWLQGYNAQAAANQNQIVLAADVMIASSDFGHLEPMLTQTRQHSPAPGSPTSPKWWSHTPAIGIRSRSRRRGLMASRCW